MISQMDKKHRPLANANLPQFEQSARQMRRQGMYAPIRMLVAESLRPWGSWGSWDSPDDVRRGNERMGVANSPAMVQPAALGFDVPAEGGRGCAFALFPRRAVSMRNRIIGQMNRSPVRVGVFFGYREKIQAAFVSLSGPAAPRSAGSGKRRAAATCQLLSPGSSAGQASRPVLPQSNAQ